MTQSEPQNLTTTPAPAGASVQSFSLLLLFALFVLLQFPVLILCAGGYQASVEGQALNQNLYTASNYLTARFRQHAGTDSVRLTTLEGRDALCFQDEIGGQACETYLYLMDGVLRELFIIEGSSAPASMGTEIAALTRFDVTRTEEGLYRCVLEDETGHEALLALDAELPVTGAKASREDTLP